jgi:hypothetical protein
MKYTTMAVAIALAGAGCASDFDPYEDVKTPRLLAIGADTSTPEPGDSATLSALVTEDATYTWSWCPLIGTSDEGFPCLVTYEEFQGAVDEAVGAGVITVPAYDLGTDPTAQLAHSVPPELWSGLCDILQSGELPGPVEFPACNEYFEVAVKVTVDFGDVVIPGVRDVRLLYEADANAANATPVIGGLSAVDPDSGDTIDLDAADPELRRDVEYELLVDIVETEAESYDRVPVEGGPAVNVREVLRFTWFHEGGEMDKSATSYDDGSNEIDDARVNLWRTPTTEERAETTARLFIVIRDDRGGTTWIEREVGLAQ